MNTVQQSFVVLLIEDEEADANLVKWALKKNAISVDFRHVLDGYAALDFLHRQIPHFQDTPHPDLIILDLNMPRMSGMECLTLIKSDQFLCDIPVVILSTSNAESDEEAARKMGAVDYFAKPMDIYQLMETIQILCERWITPGRLPQGYTS